jgi:hypothetical protein
MMLDLHSFGCLGLRIYTLKNKIQEHHTTVVYSLLKVKGRREKKKRNMAYREEA